MEVMQKNMLFVNEKTKWNYLNIMFNKYNIPLEIIDMIKRYVLVNNTKWNWEIKSFGERYKYYTNV